MTPSDEVTAWIEEILLKYPNRKEAARAIVDEIFIPFASRGDMSEIDLPEDKSGLSSQDKVA